MLQLIQVASYMMANLGYSKEEVEAIFEYALDGNTTVEYILATIGVEIGSEMGLQMMKEKLPKYKSAIFAAAMRLEE